MYPSSFFNIFTPFINGIFPLCIPFFHITIPLIGLAIVSWSVVLILTYSTDRKLRIIELIGAIIAIILGSAGMILVGFLFFAGALYIRTLTILYENASKKYGNSAILIYPLGFIFSFLALFGFSNWPSESLLGFIFILKLAVAFAGLLFIQTLIRKTGLDPVERNFNLKIRGIFLISLIFLLFLTKFISVFNSDINLYFGVLMTRLDTFVVVFLLLFAGTKYFINEEKRMEKMAEASVTSDMVVYSELNDGENPIIEAE
jgi:hypothetical protein